MPDYHFLIVGETGRVVAFNTFVADDDDLARQHVHHWTGVAHTIELWCGSRKLPPDPQQTGQRQARG